MAKKPQRRHPVLTAVLICLIVIMIAATGLMVWLCIDMVNGEPAGTPSRTDAVTLPPAQTDSLQTTPQTTLPPETTQPLPEPERVEATATISAQGDLLMHQPVFATCRQSDGSYDYESIFRYLAPYTSSYDYALANLETTFGGDAYPYQGNPTFNCPDGLAQSAVEAGYDMLLTANNHCSDTTAAGIKRTLEQVRGAGLTALGTQLDAEEPKYEVVDINGIRVGMVCYTYATGVTGDGRPSLNGLAAVAEPGLVNYFRENNLDAFYAEAKTILDNMDSDGAEATMIFLHWGVEYQLQENVTQRTMAQRLCDMGFDVIVGGHPHVVEPMALLESTQDPDHKAVVIYSLGNAVSNQRTGISNLFPTGYTEDGVMLTVTFEKYTDGSVYLAGTDVVPTWVNMSTVNGAKEYNILPLDKSREEEWKDMFNLTDALFASAQKSYDRTMGIVGEGLEACQTYLEQAKADREAYYYDLAYNPEKYAVPETTAGTVPEATADAA